METANRVTAIRRGGQSRLREAVLSGLATGSALRLAEVSEARAEALQAENDMLLSTIRVLTRGDRTRKQVLTTMLERTMDRNSSWRTDRWSRTQTSVAGFIIGIVLASVIGMIIAWKLFG